MPWAVAAAVVGAGASIYTSKKGSDAAKDAAKTAATAEERVAAENRALGEERMQQARTFLLPSISAEAGARSTLREEMGALREMAPGLREGNLEYDKLDTSAYMQDVVEGYGEFTESDVYQSLMDEAVRNVQGSAAAGGMLRSGTTLESLRDITPQMFGTYLGEAGQIRDINEQRRTGQQNINEQRYANYLNMLQSQSRPTSATNLASLGVGQAATMAQQQSQSIAAQNQYMLQGVAAQNAARADQAAAIGNIATTAAGAYGQYMGGGGGGGAPIDVGYAMQTGGTITPR